MEENIPIDIFALNDYCLENILANLDIVSQINFAKVCNKFREIFDNWARRHHRSIGYNDISALKKVTTKVDYNKMIVSQLTWRNFCRELGGIFLDWFKRQDYFQLFVRQFNFLNFCHTFRKIISNLNEPEKKVIYDYQEEYFRMIGRYVEKVKCDYGIPDETIHLIEQYCPNVREIYLFNKPIVYIEVALNFNWLRSIHFHSYYKNSQMKEYIVLLQKLPTLRCISLTNLTYSGKDLYKLTRIEELYIYDCPVVHLNLMACFRFMKNLRVLKLAKTKKVMEPDFIENEKECIHLAKLKKLKYLYIKAKYVRNPTNLLNCLTKSRLCNRLEALKIPSFNLDYDNAKCLAKIQTLKTLCVQITDGCCLKPIARLKNLLELTVCSYAMSEDSDFLDLIRKCKSLNIFNISYRFKNLKQFCLNVIEVLRVNRNPKTRRPLEICFEHIIIDRVPEFTEEFKNARNLVKFNFYWNFYNKQYDDE